MTEYDDAPSGVDKFTISLPRGSRAALQALVDAGRAANISAVIAEAVAPYTSTEQDRIRTRQQIAEMRGGAPLPPDAVAWARQALGIDTPADAGAAGAA
jgi:Arc/MetJ-type ribon-helix-helix transcriptional regulator